MRPAPARSALEHQAPHAAQRIQGTIRVRAVRRGFYDQHVKEAGQVFHIRSEQELGSWMELVSDDEPQSAGETGEGSEPKSDDTKPKADKKGGKKSGKAENDVL